MHTLLDIFIKYPLLQLLFAFAFIAFWGFITYKLTLPIGLKIIDVCFDYPVVRIGFAFFMAFVFFVTGIFQLRDFNAGIALGLAQFFPLSFISSGICLVLGVWNYKYNR